jgi:hypothetical protein
VNNYDYVFRFDDICVNADMDTVHDMAQFLTNRFENCRIIFCVSPLVHNMGNETGKNKERIFPKILNAMSDYRNFYKVNKCGIPEICEDEYGINVDLAGHGLVHVDHRLLPKESQELSILTSCSLVNAKIFVPPFNKWNAKTEDICDEHNIELIKFEDGWKCMEYNDFNPTQKMWYLHHREFTLKEFCDWFK